VDWLLTETFRCANPSRAFDICKELQRHRRDAVDLARGSLELEDIDEERFADIQASARQYQTLTKELTDIWEHHQLTAVGMGSQATSVEDNMHSIMHSFRLSATDMSSCQRRTQRIFSFTTDMGTEVKLSSATYANIAEIFPHWVDMNVEDDDGRVGGAPDGDGDRDAECAADLLYVSDDLGTLSQHHAESLDVADSHGAFEGVVDDDGMAGMEVDVLSAEDDDGMVGFAQDAQEAVPAEDVEFEFEVENDDGASPNYTDADAAPPPPLPASAALGYTPVSLELASRGFFGGSLQIAGVLHATNNALQDVLNAFTHKDWYFERIKPLIRLIAHPWTKKRLLERCFNAPEAQQHHTAIQKLTTQPTSWRFASWVPAMQQLQFVERGMREHWNLSAYNTRRGEQQDKDKPAEHEGESVPVRPDPEDGGDASKDDLHFIDKARAQQTLGRWTLDR